MATYKEKKKKLAQQRRVRKMEKDLELLATGAGMYWCEDGYWEYQDDCEKCLGNFMRAVSYRFSLPRGSFIFGFCNFVYWVSSKKLAPKVLEAIAHEKEKDVRKTQSGLIS